MIPVEYYTDVYYGVITLLILLTTTPFLFTYPNFEQFDSRTNIILILAFLIATIGFIGLRDPYGSWHYFGDTSQYTITYENIQKFKLGNAFVKDIGFYTFMWLVGLAFPVKVFYVICALLYILPLQFSFQKWFGTKSLFALALYVSSMSFWSFGINGVRNGLATSFLIAAFSIRDRKWLMFILLFLAVSFHMSVILPVIAFLIAYFLTNTKTLIAVWLSAIAVMALLGNELGRQISGLLSTIIPDDRASNMLVDKHGYIVEGSFRLDFVLYSSTAIFLGYYYLSKGIKDKFYIQLLNTYIIANTVWVILIYSSFTNRTAYLSWFIMPVILIYPLLKYTVVREQNRRIALLILISFGFTLFLQFTTH